MDFSTDMTMYHPDPSIAPLTIQQLRNIYQQQLDHQRQETQAAQAQVTLLTQQLDNETASRQLLHVRENFVCVLFVCCSLQNIDCLDKLEHKPSTTQTRLEQGEKITRDWGKRTSPLAPPRLAHFTFQIFFFFCAPARLLAV